ncbi:hypothetical protein CQS04_06695 [Chryseomicrobium excrementi]|uniref:Uncharacterized protein n=1 Tax=Chryseomicrobium excrementi TaxID=2041346 RepID=A0A2M9F057_9BACL|nr:hypothetical protein CQS04_06695 [Chryseomicrobium excrementi]
MPDIIRVASPVKRLGRFGAALLEAVPSQARFEHSLHTSQRFIWLIIEVPRFSPWKTGFSGEISITQKSGTILALEQRSSHLK